VDEILGVDVDSLVSGTSDLDEETIRAAERILHRRGIDPTKATYQQYADALVEVSS
jgi:hypothetical protein